MRRLRLRDDASGFTLIEMVRLALTALRRDVHNACPAKVTGAAPALQLTLSIPCYAPVIS
jgi:hypothetical protein